MPEMRRSAWVRRAVLAGALTILVPAVNYAAQVSGPEQTSSSSRSSSLLLSAAPNLIQFPAVPLGMISSQTLRVVNSGRLPVIVRKAFADATALTVSGLSKPLVLAAGEALSLTVAFRPERPGKLMARLTLQSDEGGATSRSRLQVNVSGEAVQAKRELTLESETLDFGNVQTGSTASRMVLLTNSGNQDVQVTKANVSSRSFSVLSGAGITLAAGQSGELEVNFRPAADGGQDEFLSLENNAGPPLRIALHGEGEKKSERPITLRWQPEESGSQGYFVYRATAAHGPFEKLNAVPIPTAEFTDEASGAGRQYFYVVTSVNENGDESPFSEPILAQAP